MDHLVIRLYKLQLAADTMWSKIRSHDQKLFKLCKTKAVYVSSLPEDKLNRKKSTSHQIAIITQDLFEYYRHINTADITMTHLMKAACK
jgi:hypothetical protein